MTSQVESLPNAKNVYSGELDDPEKYGTSHREAADSSVAQRTALEHDATDVAPLDAANYDDDPRLSTRTLLAVVAGAFGGGMQLFVLVSIGNNLLTMAKALNDFANIAWFINATIVTTTAFGPPLAILSDLFGRKWLLVIFQFIGVIGACVAGSAKSSGQLIAGTGLLGCSLASQACFYAIPSEVLPRKYRPWGSFALTTISSIMSIAAVLSVGALNKNQVGGVNQGFRWSMYLSAIVIGICACVLAVAYKPPPRPNPLNLSVGQRLAMVDWLGILILVAGVTLLFIGLNFGGAKYPWKSAGVIAPLILGILLLIFFAYYSYSLKKKNALMDRSLFGNRGYMICLFLVFVEGIVYAAFSSYYLQEVSIVWESDPVMSAVYALPFYASYLVFAPFAVLYATKTRDMNRPIALGFLFFIAAYAGLAGLNVDSGALCILMNVLAGLGFCLAFPFLIVIAQLDTPGPLIASASAFVLAVRVIGTGVGVTIFQVIVNNKIAQTLGPKIAAAVLPLGLPVESLGPFIGILSLGEPSLLATVPGITPMIIGVGFRAFQEVYVSAFRWAWIAALPFAVLGFVMCFFLPNVKIRMDGRIDAPVDAKNK